MLNFTLEFKENKATYIIKAHYDDKMEDLVTKIKKLLKYECNKLLDIYQQFLYNHSCESVSAAPSLQNLAGKMQLMLAACRKNFVNGHQHYSALFKAIA